jgi:hypothetical protein
MHTALWRHHSGRALPSLPRRAHGACGAARVARRQAERGAARRALVLDRRRRMGEGSASGVRWGDGLGTGDLGRRRGICVSHRPLLSPHPKRFISAFREEYTRDYDADDTSSEVEPRYLP